MIESRTIFNERQKHDLEHALRIAAERFAEDAQTFDEAAKNAREGGMITKDGAKRMSKEFERMARNTRELRALISDADAVELVKLSE